jgi:hypothetical protein
VGEAKMKHLSNHLLLFPLLCGAVTLISPNNTRAQTVMVLDRLPQVEFRSSPVLARNSGSGTGELRAMAASVARDIL